MVNKEVRSQLLKQLGISPQALSQRAKRLKDKYGPMTTDEAVYVIAHMEGVDLSKRLPLASLDRVRSLIPRELNIPTLRHRQSRSTHPKKKLKPASYPLVEKTIVSSAISIGAEVYPQVFILENSIRSLIKKHLSKTGNDWWDKLVPADVKKEVLRTMSREKRYPYREARGNHPLFYSNFSDLKKIILANQTSFATIIIDFDWFRVKMEEVYMARNSLAHCVSLSKDDISRIALFYRDWARLLETAREK